MTEKYRWIFIAWAPYNRRSESFAHELGGKLYFIHYLRFQSPIYAPFKYIAQSVHTLLVLFSERPDVIHVLNPPFVLGLVVYFYCLIFRKQFVLDHHSAAFAGFWHWALPVQKHLARKAAINIVTNQIWANVIRSWGARPIIMTGPVPILPEARAFKVKPGFNIVYVSIFAVDEPVDAVIEAAVLLPEVNFYITGNWKRAQRGFLDMLPPNVTCTGFLPDDEYIGLLQASDVIMVLTTRDFTLQLGGLEAISVGKPLLTSDWPYLKQVFSAGTVFVSNSGEGIRDGVIFAQKNYALLKKSILSLGHQQKKEWQACLAQLKKEIG